MVGTAAQTSRRTRSKLLIGLLLAVLVSTSPAVAAAAYEPERLSEVRVAISGIVTGGGDDTPAIPGARIDLIDDSSEATVAQVVTSSTGRYEIKDIEVNGQSFSLVVTPPDGSPFLRRQVRPIVPDPSAPNIVDVVLTRGASISGSVSLSSGGSPQGATVAITRGAYSADTRVVGADGLFTVVGLISGDWQVQATLAGNTPATVQLVGTQPGKTYPVNLQLLSPPTPGVVSGTVTSRATGDPLSGITVERAGKTTQTDIAGQYLMSDAAVGSYPMSFSDPIAAFVAMTTSAVAVASGQKVDSVDVALDPAAVVSGTVRDSDGEPLPGVLVTSPGFDTDLSGLSDYAGRYRIAGIPAGTYTLVGRPTQPPAITSSLETNGPQIKLSTGQNLSGVDFALDAFSLISGTLSRSAPVEGNISDFRVTYMALDEANDENQTAYLRTARPDESGRYELRMPPGRYLIRVAPPWTPDGGYETSYHINWWANIHQEFDYEYPSSSLDSGTKIFVVDRNTSATLDLMIDRGSPFTEVPYSVIDGTPAAGATLKITTIGGWEPKPRTISYEWRRNSIPITGATNASYVVTTADAGARLTVAVTARLGTDGIDTTVTAAVVGTKDLDPTPVPTIGGAAVVGATVEARAGTWGPSPVMLTYQWKRNGSVIQQATSSSYTVIGADAGRSISVTVTGSRPGYTSESKTSKAIDVPAQQPSVERIAGADRFEGSTLISKQVAPTGSKLVYLASGENFPDSLSGSAVAAQRAAPLLLAKSGSIPSVVAAELVRLKPEDVVVLGGEFALSEAVTAQIAKLVPSATVTRIGGADRYEVSRNLIVHPRFGALPSTELFITTGRNFPDALGAAPAAASVGAPVLLVDGQRASLTTAEKSLLRDRQVTRVTTFGGTASLSAGLTENLARLEVDVVRISGADRFVVSEKTADVFFPAGEALDVVYVAAGSNFPDALTGGVIAGSGSGAPILLAQKECLDQAMVKYITTVGAKRIVILGGPTRIAFLQFPFPIC